MRNVPKIPLAIVLFLIPISSFAATFGAVVTTIGGKLNSFIPPLLALGSVLVVYGIVRYINAGDDAKRREEGRTVMLWGIIGLFVMLSFWGLVNVLITTVFGSVPGGTINVDSLFN